MGDIRIKEVDARSPPFTDILRSMHKVVMPADTFEHSLLTTARWWVAFLDGTPAGFAGLSPSRQFLDAGYLCRAGVLPFAQGRGIQRKLIRIREKAARKAGLGWIISDTYRNPISANNLISCGFRMYEPSNPWGARDTLYWLKKTAGTTPAKETQPDGQ